jgi:uncharacterized protein YoaH (UPF0181 family)
VPHLGQPAVGDRQQQVAVEHVDDLAAMAASNMQLLC